MYSFASRRIGPEAASVLVDAMVSGIYAGDPENLSLEAAFPRMAAMEARYGSLVRAMIALMRERKKARKRAPAGGGGPMGPGGALTSFDEGMEVLIRRLAEILGSRLSTGTRVTGLTRLREGYRVDLESRGEARSVSARNVVMAVPSHVAAAILKDAAPRLAWRLDEIPYAGITVACLIYPRSHVAHPLDGFGFLVPRDRGRESSGASGPAASFRLTSAKTSFSCGPWWGERATPRGPSCPRDARWTWFTGNSTGCWAGSRTDRPRCASIATPRGFPSTSPATPSGSGRSERTWPPSRGSTWPVTPTGGSGSTTACGRPGSWPSG